MGSVITFYSYKGGVGRTMALANVAILLSKWNYKVLVVDWDLEAPGLEYFFKNFVSLEDIHSSKGIVDLLVSYISGDEQLSWKDVCLDVKIGDDSQPISFIPSGCRKDNYYENLRKLDIEDFYSNKNGGALVENIRNEWKSSYDFILIDSRTGITDIGGICTIQMPDILVLLFTATEQSLNGTKDIAERSVEAIKNLPVDRTTLLCFPIPTRVDTSEEFKSSQEWLTRFSLVLKEIYGYWVPTSVNLKEFLDVIKIPYVPYFSFGEKLAVLEQGTRDPQSIGYAYHTISAIISQKLRSIELLMTNRDKFVDLSYSRTTELDEGVPEYKVLILSASSSDRSRLALDMEYRTIFEALKRNHRTSVLDIKSTWASRISDVRRALLDANANIIHFSGHGMHDEGLVLEDSAGQTQIVDSKALAQLFSLFPDIKCVILNSCYSSLQAKEISKYIDHVIGISHEIKDDDALSFSTAFYDAISAGRSIDFSYEIACNSLRLSGVSDTLTPILINKKSEISQHEHSHNKYQLAFGFNKDLLVEIFVETGKDGHGFIETGYPVAKNIIITSRLLISDNFNSLHVRWHYQKKPDWIILSKDDCIIWDGKQEGLDVVLIKCPFPDGVTRYAKLSAKKPKTSMKWESEGFADIDKRGGMRHSVSIQGQLYSSANSANTFELGVDFSPDRAEDWRGITGSPVFVGEEIIGIIQSAPEGFKGTRLTATPTWKLLEIESFRNLVGLNEEKMQLLRWARENLMNLLGENESLRDVLNSKLHHKTDSLDEIINILIDSPTEEILRFLSETKIYFSSKADFNNIQVINKLLSIILPVSFYDDLKSFVINKKDGFQYSLLKLPIATNTVAEIVMAGVDSRPVAFKPVSTDEELPEGVYLIPPLPQSDLYNESFVQNFHEYMIRKFAGIVAPPHAKMDTLIKLASTRLKHLASRPSNSISYYYTYVLPEDKMERDILISSIEKLQATYPTVAFIELSNDGSQLVHEYEKLLPLTEFLHNDANVGAS